MKKKRNILIDIITSKSFIGSFAFAIALWIYTSLNAEFTTFKKIPVTVILPENRSIASEIPKNITIEIKSNGWHLLNVLFINPTAGCVINLSEEKYLDSIKISRKEYLKGLYNLNNINTVDIQPESFVLYTGKVFEIAVPIKSNLKITPYEGYMVVGDVHIHPNMVLLRGNVNVVKNFNYWNTAKIEINGLYESTEAVVNLSDTLNNIIKLSENLVTAEINIQQIAEQRIYDIPVKILGGQLSSKHHLKPEFISVIIRGGINQLYDFNPESIVATVDIEDVLKDSTGVIVPEIKVPSNIKAVSVHPKYLTHKIIDNYSRK